MVAQYHRDGQRAREAGELGPGQRLVVHSIGEGHGGNEGGNHVQHDGRDDQPAELRRAVAGGGIAFLLKPIDVVGSVEGVPAAALLDRGEFVQLGQAGIAAGEAVPVLAPQVAGLGIDDDHRLADGLGVSDHVGGAPLAVGRLAVPQGDEYVRAVDGLQSAVEISVLARPLGVDDPQVLCARERPLHFRPAVRREVLAKLRPRQGQDGVPGHAEILQLLDEQLIAARGDRRQPDPFAGDFLAQGLQRRGDGSRGGGRIGELPVAGEADDVKNRNGRVGRHEH